MLLDPSCSGSGTANADVDASIAAAAAAAALSEEGGGGDDDQQGGKSEEEEERKRKKKSHRLEKLASFQLSALKHALSFPKALRVAYSTCSVHFEENERVVAAALAWLCEGEGEEKKAKAGSSSSASPPLPPHPKGWRLARALPSWPTRGISEEEGGHALSLSAEDAAKVIRAHPATDGTDGFFVAVFGRSEAE